MQSGVAYQRQHDAVVEEKGAHIHGSDVAGVEAAAAVCRMKRRASETQEGKLC